LGRRNRSEIATDTAMDIPQDATTPNECQKETNRSGNGIFRAVIVDFNKTKPALLLAMKTVLSRLDIVHNAVKMIKASEKIIFTFINARAGDQKPSPVMKIAAITMVKNPLIVKQEFIKSCGFLAWGRKRMRELFSPAILIIASRPMAEMIAEL